MTLSRDPPRHLLTLQWMVVSAGLLSLACGAGWLLTRTMRGIDLTGYRFPPTFLASTGFLLLGSWSLSRSVAAIRRERQGAFLRGLSLTACCGLLFVAFQWAALNWLFHQQSPAEVQTGDRALVAAAAALHVLHFVVAILMLTFVILQARRGRYDHEYYWGVSVCAWLWHALAYVWLAILAIVLISGIPEPGPRPVLDRRSAAEP